jgi:hypothetical protein
MSRIPVPLRVVLVVALVAIGVSGLHGALSGRGGLVLEPATRDEAVRLGTLDERAEREVAPALPSVPTLAPGTSLARAHRGEASAAERGDDLSAEMRLVSEARRTMAEDPAEALALLDQHRERYPAGALREEREAHAILILRRLDRTADAERRYTDFLSDFPESSFLPVLRGDPARDPE